MLIDRDRANAASRTENRAELLEVRANAFAAEFLMPAEGILQFVHALGTRPFRTDASLSQVYTSSGRMHLSPMHNPLWIRQAPMRQ